MKREACRIGSAALLLVTFAGCTSLTPEQLEARDYAQAEFQHRFATDRAECFEKGGQIEVAGDAVRLDRNGIPERKTRYLCVLSRS